MEEDVIDRMRRQLLSPYVWQEYLPNHQRGPSDDGSKEHDLTTIPFDPKPPKLEQPLGHPPVLSHQFHCHVRGMRNYLTSMGSFR